MEGGPPEEEEGVGTEKGVVWTGGEERAGPGGSQAELGRGPGPL